MRPLSAIAVFASVASSQASTQRLESYALTSQLSEGAARTYIESRFAKADSRPVARSGASLYRIQYWSKGAQGKPVLLSGLVAFPEQKLPIGRVLYMHGATAIRSDVPSRVGPNSTASPETWDAMLAFACGGYTLIAPDYLGLGIDKGPHPFAMGKANVSSAVDLILAVDELAQKLQVTPGDRLMVTGYSEGAALSAWVVRELQSSPDPRLRVTRWSPIAGAYDLSGAQLDAMLAQQSSLVDLAVREYFAAYFIKSVEAMSGAPLLAKCFASSFASYIPIAFGDQVSDLTIAKKLGVKGLQLGALTSIRKVLTEDFWQELRTRSPQNPVVTALLANDCFDWKPECLTYFLGVKADNVVVFRNTENAVRAMRRLGLGTDRLNYRGVRGSGLNHFNAPAPLLAIARKFFDRGFAGVDCDPDPTADR